ASDEEILAQLERLAQINSAAEGGEAWRSAAEAVSSAVQKALEAEKAGEGEGTMNPELAKDLFLRTARWLREHVGDSEAAEGRLRLAIEQDPQSAEALLALEEVHRSAGRERDLITTLRQLAELAQASGADIERSPSELRREAKVLAETQLGDNDLAEQILREMLEADEADVWALTELCGVVEKNEDYKELYTLLTRRIELMPEPSELRELRHKAARVAADRLDDLEAAIGLFEQAFEDDPRDTEAATALRELYAKLKRHEDMLRLIERLMDQSDSPSERADLRLESARICIEILEAPTEGIDHLHAVLEEVPGHPGAVRLLVKMLEKEGRDDELADLLNKQIELARQKGERDQELGYRVKLSELYETKLNDSDRAITGYLGVIDADPAFKPALRALTRLYEQQGKSREAAETSEKLLGEVIATGKADDDDDLVRLALKARDLYIAVGDKEAASRVLERTLEVNPALLPSDGITSLRDAARTLYRDRQAWDKLAELYAQEGDEATEPADKVMRYRQAAEINSKERGDHAAAATLMQKALDLKSDDRELMLALCDEYTKSGRGKEAIEVLNRVVESYGGRRSKELAEIHHRIASAHLSEGDRESALKEFESARKMDPGSVSILLELGTLLLKLADDADDSTKQKAYVKDAGNAFRALLLQRLDADAPVGKAEVFYLLAEVSKRENDKKKAIQMAERALSNDKEHAKAKALLAELKS
ncbi:MAG TPA: tetratricopeptide repeat protein, partial [Polyangiaceae bacterium]|nr:tetratricopeptide repeat protein [Polyangiaceae bacterium]